MKVSRLIICIACVVLVVVGWFSFFREVFAPVGQYDAHIKQGDKYYKEGLFHRAIDQYEAALTYEVTGEAWDKNIEAHLSRYQEAPDFYSNYIDCLQRAIMACPSNVTYVQTLVDLYEVNQKYLDAYTWILQGEKNGVTSDRLKAQKLEFRYLFTLGGRTFTQFQPATCSAVTSGIYSAALMQGAWGYIYGDESDSSDFNLEYMGQFSDTGIHVANFPQDSRILRWDGYVLGIFEDKVIKAGVYADGLMPAQAASGKWYYYDEFAREKLGPYDEAGTFQSGKAAVKQNGEWFIITTTGERAFDQVFSEILLDGQGRYLSEKNLVVAAEQGAYALYNEKLEKVSKDTWSDADCCNNTNLIAVKKDGKWGYVNETGTMVIEPQFDEAKSFSYTMGAVCKDGKWGFINSANELAIDYQFLDVDSFNSSGRCMVKTAKEDEEVWRILELAVGLT